MMQQFKTWYQDHREQILRDFFTFLEFPSVSADPSHHDDCRRCAEWLKGYLNQIGLQTEIWETPGLPVIYASDLRAGPERPTVLIYHHYDVQPADPIELWKSQPFKPTIRNNQVYARGAADNKGQCFYTLTTLKAIFELGHRLNVNLKLFIEGEEESGGKGTLAAILEHQDQLKADYLLVIDFGLPASQVPGITLGMRGIVSCDVECTNSATDLHSGEHGGIALNPNRALANVLSQLWDASGKVMIPGFYDAVERLSKENLARIDTSFDKKEYTESFGVKAFCPEQGISLRESNWLRPTVEINGMWGGYIGSGFKTVIPSKAYAKISCRLVSNQDPEKIMAGLTQFLQSKAPQGIEMKVHMHAGARAYRTSFDSPLVKTVALAYEEIFEKPCRYLFSGGSVPIVVDLAQATGADVAMIGMGLAGDDIHAPNEHFGLDRLELGYLTLARILDRLE